MITFDVAICSMAMYLLRILDFDQWRPFPSTVLETENTSYLSDESYFQADYTILLSYFSALTHFFSSGKS